MLRFGPSPLIGCLYPEIRRLITISYLCLKLATRIIIHVFLHDTCATQSKSSAVPCIFHTSSKCISHTSCSLSLEFQTGLMRGPYILSWTQSCSAFASICWIAISGFIFEHPISPITPSSQPLVRFSTPPPHVTVQVSHSPHSPQ